MNQHLPASHYTITHTLILYSEWIMVVVSGLSFRRRIPVSTGNDQRCFLQVAQVEAGHEQKESRSLLEIDLQSINPSSAFPAAPPSFWFVSTPIIPVQPKFYGSSCLDLDASIFLVSALLIPSSFSVLLLVMWCLR